MKIQISSSSEGLAKLGLIPSSSKCLGQRGSQCFRGAPAPKGLHPTCPCPPTLSLHEFLRWPGY